MGALRSIAQVIAYEVVIGIIIINIIIGIIDIIIVIGTTTIIVDKTLNFVTIRNIIIAIVTITATKIKIEVVISETILRSVITIRSVTTRRF